MDGHGQQHRRQQQRRPRRTAYLFGWWVVLFGLWFLYVDSLAHPEVIFGPAAAVLALLSVAALLAQGGALPCLRPRWLPLLRDVPASVLRDCAVLALVLWRRLARRERVRGVWRTVPVPTGNGDDATAISWRAFVIGVTSVAPNTYVIDIDQERGVALVHQLVPDRADDARRAVVGAAPDAEWRAG